MAGEGEEESLRVVCGTWNVNQLDPYAFDNQQLKEWLCTVDPAPDFIAVCLQEIGKI